MFRTLICPLIAVVITVSSDLIARCESPLQASRESVSETEPQWRWKQAGDAVALMSEDNVLWQFNYNTEKSKAYFHPVSLLSGAVLTADRPADHPWHHAMWFSWKYIDHVNYWEEDRETGQCEGRTSWSNVKVEARDDFSARITMDLAYANSAGETVMTGKRAVDVSSPDKEGNYYFDWDCQFTAAQNSDSGVELGRTPTPDEPGGQAWGGYAGLSVRFAVGMKNQQLFTSKGAAPFDRGRYRGKAAAMDYSGTIDDQLVGIAIFDHSSNPTHPTSWYADASTTMSYFSPAVLYDRPLRLGAGESLAIRYRVLIHAGAWEPHKLSKEYETYINKFGHNKPSEPQFLDTGNKL